MSSYARNGPSVYAKSSSSSSSSSSSLASCKYLLTHKLPRTGKDPNGRFQVLFCSVSISTSFTFRSLGSARVVKVRATHAVDVTSNLSSRPVMVGRIARRRLAARQLIYTSASPSPPSTSASASPASRRTLAPAHAPVSADSVRNRRRPDKW